jgi:hypothetical protein
MNPYFLQLSAITKFLNFIFESLDTSLSALNNRLIFSLGMGIKVE